MPDHSGQSSSDKKPSDDNIVFVGKKPAMSYVMAVVTQFGEGMPEVHVRARGKSISRAVDVAEVYRNRFDPKVSCSIDIGTEEVRDEQGSPLNVSTINIVLRK